MASITCFDCLPDLVLLELFSYLSSIDILWGFTGLNHRLTMLITERGFFNYINLSSTRYHQFNSILRFLPLNDIQSLSIDYDASPLQLIHWPYLPRLRILRISGVYNLNNLLFFLSLHAETLTHLIIKSNERLIPDGSSMEFEYPIDDTAMLIENILHIHLPALQSLDMGMNHYQTLWPITTAIASLTYLRLSLGGMKVLLCVISTQPLANTLRQLHIQMDSMNVTCHSPACMANLSIRMVNLHTFTLVQTFFSELTIEWTDFEVLTSSNVMPVLRRANVSLLLNTNDLNCIGSSSLFIDHRHVDVHFVFNIINCSQYINVTSYIPRGNRFYPREIVGAIFIVNHWCQDKSKWLINDDPFTDGKQYYRHMWYTLPWAFDEFFHKYIPYKWITKTQVFERSSKKVATIDQSSLRTLDASGQTLSSAILSLPHIVLHDSIETLHLSFYNKPLRINFSSLRHLTLVNSINCFNCLPTTIRSIRILLFHTYPNYMLPNWKVIFDSLSTLRELNSLRIFTYDLQEIIDDKSCQMIAKIGWLCKDFGFYFRHKFCLTDDWLEMVFKDHIKFIKLLYHYILLLCLDQQSCYSIEDDGCGFTMWS